MLFMIIERFQDNDMRPVYRKVRSEGRLLPEGLKYVDSWVEANFARCFQVMECDDLRVLQEWMLRWAGTGVSFEVVPIVSSRDARDVVTSHLDPT